MSVILSNAEIGPSRRELKIEIPFPAVEAERLRVIDHFRHRVALPGFRRGKAPAAVVERRYQDDIDREVLDRLVPRYWRQAQAEAGLELLLPPAVSHVHFEPGQPVVFSATVDVKPEIELRNYKDFELPPWAPEPTADDQAAALEELRRNRARWNPVERPALRGDVVEGQLTEVGAEPAGPRPVAFEVGAERIWEELSLAATGLPIGREAEFSRQEEGGEAGPVERKYVLRVERVREQALPTLDDELAKQLGVEDLEALQKALAERLRYERRMEGRARRERAVLEQLAERHPLTLPDAVVEQEMRVLLQDYAEHLARQGVDLERAGIDWAQEAERMRPEAAKRVQIRLVLEAIAQAEGVDVSDADFEAAIAGIARSQNRSTPALRKELDEAGKLGSLKAQLRRERTLRHLLGDEVNPPTEGG